MKKEIMLEIPDEINRKLATGECKRIGGVIIEEKTGKVVTWLRETSPEAMKEVPKVPNSKLDYLGTIGHIASIINLGATVAFGFKTLEKLDQIDEKLDIIIAKLEELNNRIKHLQWTVEVGFANTLQALEVNKRHHEFQISGDLSGAANVAWSCQFLEPNSHQRITRIENAYNTVTTAKETILLHTNEEVCNAIKWIESKDIEDHNFIFDENVIKSLYRLQQAIVACSLQASISSEANDLFAASSQLKMDYTRLYSLFIEIVKIFFDKGASVYRVLLGESCANFMSAERLGVYAEQFLLDTNNLAGIIELLRKEGFPDKELVSQASSNDTGGGPYMAATSVLGASFIIAHTLQVNEDDGASNQTYGLIDFFDLIDGIAIDLDKLNGHGEEYKAASELNLTVHEYRDLLCLDDVEGVSSNLAFISITPE